MYNRLMKYKLSTLADKLRVLLGDNTVDIPEDFLREAYNYTVNALPMVPKLEKLFSKHKKFNLDADGHYKWSMSKATGFRRINSLPLLKFYTSTGGKQCPLPLCHLPVVNFYEKNGLVEMNLPGTPCEYTIEEEDDDVYLVLDRPTDVPIIVQYIAYGFPEPATSMDDEIELSAIAEPLVLDVMKTLYLMEASDYAFAADVRNYLDNKKELEAIQMLHRQFGMEGPRVLGEV